MSITTRPAHINDLPRLTEIYNHYVVNTSISFDVDAATPEERYDWLSQFALSGPYRLLVAEADGVLLGYAGSTRARPRKAYDATIETTVYCAPEAVGRGAGSALYTALFDALEGEELHVAMAAIAVPNPPSVALHERFGFQEVGRMREVGRKFGRYWDVVWYEKMLS